MRMKQTNSSKSRRNGASRSRRNDAQPLGSHNGSSAREKAGSSTSLRSKPNRQPSRQVGVLTTPRATPRAEAQTNHLQERRAAQYASALKSYDAATRLFRREEYGKAREIFKKLAATAPPELAERSAVHLRLCQNRTRRPDPLPKTAAECYVMGIAQLNSRDLESAINHLERADQLQPGREEVRYALAAAHALQGNVDEALTHLQATLTLRPANSFQIRQDEDFALLAADPRFRALVYAGGGKKLTMVD